MIYYISVAELFLMDGDLYRKQYIIKGGQPLRGEDVDRRCKNAALGIIVAAIMANEPVTIENLPDVDDVRVLLDAVEGIGAIVERFDAHTVRINGALY